MPSVPDPKASFPGLFDAHRGDFQVTPVPVLPRHALLAPPPPRFPAAGSQHGREPLTCARQLRAPSSGSEAAAQRVPEASGL